MSAPAGANLGHMGAAGVSAPADTSHSYGYGMHWRCPSIHESSASSRRGLSTTGLLVGTPAVSSGAAASGAVGGGGGGAGGGGVTGAPHSYAAPPTADADTPTASVHVGAAAATAASAAGNLAQNRTLTPIPPALLPSPLYHHACRGSL